MQAPTFQPPPGNSALEDGGFGIREMAAIIAALLVVAAIVYIWSRMMNEKGTMSDGSVGSIMDGNEDVRRVDLGTHLYVAQKAEEQLTAEGYTCRTVTLESGAFGIGLGDHHYLVFNAEDQERVSEVIDELLFELDLSSNDLEGFDA